MLSHINVTHCSFNQETNKSFSPGVVTEICFCVSVEPNKELQTAVDSIIPAVVWFGSDEAVL